jgi:hypothetical protein
MFTVSNNDMKNQTNSQNVGFEVFTAVVMKSINFWDITPCSPLSVNRRFGETYRLPLPGRRNNFRRMLLATCLLAGFLLKLFLPLKMEAICSSETLVDTQRTARRYIPEVDTLHRQPEANLSVSYV